MGEGEPDGVPVGDGDALGVADGDGDADGDAVGVTDADGLAVGVGDAVPVPLSVPVPRCDDARHAARGHVAAHDHHVGEEVRKRRSHHGRDGRHGEVHEVGEARL